MKATGSYTKKSSACKAVRSVALAYYKCRRPKGIKASCNGRTISGLKCTEKRGLTNELEFNATVTCKKGSKKLVHTYQQNLQDS